MALKLIDEERLDVVINTAKDDLQKNPNVEGLREFIGFMDLVKASLKPLPESYSKEQELLWLLTEIRNYHEGEGKYNFSNLNSNDRNNASFDAWQVLYQKIITATETYPDQKQQPPPEVQQYAFWTEAIIHFNNSMDAPIETIIEELKKQFTIQKR